MKHTRDSLLLPLEQLEQALAADVPGHEREWTERMGAALGEVAQALRERAADSKAPDGLFAEVDLTRPTLARQASELCQENVDFLKEAQALQAEVQNARHAFKPHSTLTGPTPALPEPPGSGTIPDFGTLRQRIEHFLNALKHHKEGETDLILESVNTDLGVGD